MEDDNNRQKEKKEKDGGEEIWHKEYIPRRRFFIFLESRILHGGAKGQRGATGKSSMNRVGRGKGLGKALGKAFGERMLGKRHCGDVGRRRLGCKERRKRKRREGRNSKTEVEQPWGVGKGRGGIHDPESD